MRGFFEQCFAPLVARIFGYSGPSWLGQVARGGRDADARALLRLLAPTGPLFTAVYSVDADGSTRFHFPRQRLPAHTQMLLAIPKGVTYLAMWPQYAAASDDATAIGKGHIHVSVFQYFCYWFAFYAIKGGDVAMGEGIDPGRRTDLGIQSAGGIGSSVRRAADALHLTRGKDADLSIRRPYIAVLRQFLLEMVPRPDSVATATTTGAVPSPLASPRRTAAGNSPYFRTSSGNGKRAGDAVSRGMVFYSTLLEFWVKDADEPVPAILSGRDGPEGSGRGAASQHIAPVASIWSKTYDPPSDDLLEAVVELIQYATTAPSLGRNPGSIQPAQTRVSWLPTTPVLTMTLNVSGPGHVLGSSANALVGPPRLGAAVQPGAQALYRQLYRFFHRAFSMWPDQRSMKGLLRAFLAFIAPWQSEFAGASGAPAPGTSALTSHLTAHVSDLVHRVSRTEVARGGSSPGPSSNNSYSQDWETHVLGALPFYLELLPLYLERAVSRVSVRGESAVGDVVRVLGVLESSPALLDLLRQVERDFNAYVASQPRRAEGPFAELLPWLIDQISDWQVVATANSAGDTPAFARGTPSYAMFATAGERCAALSGKDILDLSSMILKPETMSRVQRTLEQVLPIAALRPASPPGGLASDGLQTGVAAELPLLPRSSWKDVKFRGDSLEKPVASYEIGSLVRLTAALSKRLNAWLRLNRVTVDDGEEEAPENRVQEILACFRRRGNRVNLRPLADVRTLFWLPVVWWVVTAVLQAVVWLVRAIAS